MVLFSDGGTVTSHSATTGCRRPGGCCPRDRGKDTSKKVIVGVPYIKGLSEELRTFRAHVVDSFKPSNMLHQLLWSSKDPKIHRKNDTSEVIYQINCEGIGKDSGCRSTYIGESGRILKARFVEHLQLALGPQRCHNTCTSRGDKNIRFP